MKKLFLLLSLFCMSFASRAQLSWFAATGTTTSVKDVNVCDDTTYSVYLLNPTAAALSSPSLDLQLPSGIEYIAGSLQIEAPSVSVTEGDIANLNNPIFTVANIPANGAMIFTYRVRAICGGAANSVQVPITLTYDGNATSQPIGLSAVNINSASLNIVAATNANYTGNLSTTYSQTITLRNAGLGYLRLNRPVGDNFVKVKLNSTNCLAISNPSIGTLSGDTLTIPLNAISANLTGDADQLWENNEDLLITYDVTINCCDDLSRGITPFWGCDASTCNVGSTFNTNVIIDNGVPNLDVTVPILNYDYCFDGMDNVIQTLRIVNNGTGAASNIRLGLGIYYPGGYVAPLAYDTLWVLKSKAGVILDTLKDATNIFGGGFSSFYRNSSCLATADANHKPNLTRQIDYVLQPGDTVYVDVLTHATNYNCLSCMAGNQGVIAIQAAMHYNSQCGVDNYILPAKLVASRYYMGIFPGSPSLPSDLADNQEFDLALNNFSVSEGGHPSGRSQMLMYVALAGSNLTPNGPVQILRTNLTYVTAPSWVSNDTLWIDVSATPSFKGYQGTGIPKMKIPLIANCGTGGSHSVNIGGVGIYDTTCNPKVRMNFGCISKSFTMHCPAPCPRGGATPKSFSLNRINFGLPDNNNNNLAPNGATFADSSLLAMKSVVNADTLLGKWAIKINENTDTTDANMGIPHTYTYIEVPLPVATIDCDVNTNLLIPMANAEVTIYPVGGGAPINCLVTPTVTSGKAIYDLNSCRSPWLPGDSIAVNAKFVARYVLKNASAFRNQIISPNVYSSYVPNPVSPTDMYTCDNFSDEIKFLGLGFYSNIPFVQKIGCIGLTQYIFGYSAYGLFPYEYRTFGTFDSLRVRIPIGFTYSIGNAAIGGVPIPNGNVVVDNGWLVLSNLKTLFSSYGGAIPITDFNSYTLAVTFDPPCNAIANAVYQTSFAPFVLGNGINNVGLYGFSANCSNLADTTTVFSNTITYRAPSPSMQGGGTISIINDSASWNILRQNASNTVDAPNSWIHLTNIQGTPLTNIIVKQGATAITPDSNGFYQLGNNAKSSSTPYTITGNTADCDTIQYVVKSGWGCAGYPTNINTPDLCFELDTLVAIPLPAGTDAILNVINNNGNTSNFCTPIEVEIVLNSTQLSDLATMGLDYVLPFGFNYVANSAMVQYPINTAYRTPSNMAAITINESLVNIDVNNIDSLLNNGITGSYNADNKTMKLKLQLTTQCGASSGDVLSALYNSVSACGEVLPLIIKESNPIIFTEAVVPGYTTTPTLIADTINGCNAASIYTADVMIDINQITSPSQSSDSIYVTFPPGAVFDSYNSTAAGQQFQPMVAVPNGPVDVGNGRMRYSWPMTGGLPSGTIHFKFTYKFDYAQYTSCNQLLKSFVVTTGGNTPVTCNGDTCSLFNINGRGTGDMNINLPSLQASIQTSNCTYYPANGITVSSPMDLVISNTGTSDIAAGTTTRVDLYCDADNSGTITPGDNVLQQVTTLDAIPTGGSATISNVVITYDDLTCMSKKVLVKVSRIPSVGVEQCLCEQPATNFACISTPLPIIGLSFSGIPKEVGNLLSWKVTQEVNFSHYILERSTETESNYKPLSTIKGKQATNYSYTDMQPSNKEYYRLKMIDIDGKSAYSETVLINRSNIVSDNIYVYPNPVINTLNLVCYGNGLDETVELSIMDIVGKVIKQEVVELQKGINTFKFNTEFLSSGHYILRIKNSEHEQAEFVKFTK